VNADAAAHRAQRTFRALLAALSYPGRVTVVDEPVDAPRALGCALSAGMLTLFDRETAVWVARSERSRIGTWLIAKTGCRLVTDPAQAEFALILDPQDALPLDRWNPGSPEDPEESATLLMRVEDCTGGAPVTLAGPGIEHEVTVAPRTLPPGFWPEWSINAARYPMGIDCFFFDDRGLVGLPRTARQLPA
jgi:alpha-D-ribose 1-methylphosphonate 5-triphosphate synthase subunit PhnH